MDRITIFGFVTDRVTLWGAALIFAAVFCAGLFPALELAERLALPQVVLSPTPAGTPGFGPAPIAPTTAGRHRLPDPPRHGPPLPYPTTSRSNRPTVPLTPTATATPTLPPLPPLPTVRPSTPPPEVVPTATAPTSSGP